MLKFRKLFRVDWTHSHGAQSFIFDSQMLENYKLKSADGLSLYLLYFWLAGKPYICNSIWIGLTLLFM